MPREASRFSLCLLIMLLTALLTTAVSAPQTLFNSLDQSLPSHSASAQLIHHLGYVLSYSEQHEQAAWVVYQLTKQKVQGTVGRTDDFRADPAVRTGSASLADFRGSGFDRGHLAPAADMAWSQQAMSESFFLSNMSPQRPGFNRGIWSSLEALVRTWAVECEEIYVVTGPVLKGELPAIGPNQVSIPAYFYKVVLDSQEPELKGIGFILANEPSRQPLQTYAVTIDSVETFTGIDFFPALPDSLESALESTLTLSNWTFQAANSAGPRASAAVQCSGITKAGQRCKRMTTNANGYCWQHQGQAEAAVTKEPVAKSSDADVIVYITKTGTKYHRASCSSLSRSRIPISLKEAKERGYGPCARCRPPS